jgi:hypothetical protein
MNAGHAAGMKTTANGSGREHRRRTETYLDEQVGGLFRRIPELSGFSVRDDLELDDIVAFFWPRCDITSELYDEIMQALVDLTEERPDAIDLLRGRTFARALH